MPHALLLTLLTQPARDLLFFTGPRAAGGTGSADGGKPILLPCAVGRLREIA